jgi:hypothetical protein
MPTTFPFLKIAREHHVPYGSVVRMSEAIPKMIRSVPPHCDLTAQEVADYDFYRHPILINDIAHAIADERQRRVEAGNNS